jgi:hypothetical protein
MVDLELLMTQHHHQRHNKLAAAVRCFTRVTHQRLPRLISTFLQASRRNTVGVQFKLANSSKEAVMKSTKEGVRPGNEEDAKENKLAAYAFRESTKGKI